MRAHHLLHWLCLVVTLVVHSGLGPHTLTLVAATGQLRTQWPHLDCSACLAVAEALGKRMNATLASMPGSYLVSHRLDGENNLKRLRYKRGELRGVEVLDKLCMENTYREHFMRLNAKTKVRGFHIRDYGTARSARRDEFLERDFFPNASGPGPYFASRLDGILMPVAHFYNRREHEEMGKRIFYDASRAACSVFADEKDEQLTAIVRELDWLSEVEEQLCGLRWGHVVVNTRALLSETEGDSTLNWPGLPEPVSDVCMDAAAIESSARLDQRRWYAWSQKRRAAREARAAEAAAASARARERAAQRAADWASRRDDKEAERVAQAGLEDGAAGDL